MIGFTFRGIHSSDFNIGFKSVDRTAIPERRKKEFKIMGRSGTFELESHEYEKRKISGIIGIMNTDNFEDLRNKVREIANWLTQSGSLIFDDEPDKVYKASIYSAIGIEQLQLQPKATIKVDFECQPFATSRNLNQLIKQGGATQIFKVKNNGNVNTSGTFIMKNTGTTTITNIRITRKVII